MHSFKSGIARTAAAMAIYSPFIFSSFYIIIKNIAAGAETNLEKASIVFVSFSVVLLFAVGFFNFFYITVETKANGLRLRRGGITYAYLRYKNCDVQLTSEDYAIFFFPRKRYAIECSNLEKNYRKRQQTKKYICHFFDEEAFESLQSEVERSKKEWLESRTAVS